MFVVGGIPIKDVCGRCEIIEREWCFFYQFVEHVL